MFLEYDNIVDLWNYELRGPCTITTAETATATPWYSQAFDYWESEVNCPITDDGVLGGYGALTPMDSRYVFRGIYLTGRHLYVPVTYYCFYNYDCTQ